MYADWIWVCVICRYYVIYDIYIYLWLHCSLYLELHKKWLLLTEIDMEFTFSTYCRSFSDIVQLSITGWRHLDFHQLPLLRQGILLNCSHCFPNCCFCLYSGFHFAQKSFLTRELCFYFQLCKKVKRKIIVWSNNIATNCNLNLAVL